MLTAQRRTAMDLQIFFDDFLHSEGFHLLTQDLYELFDCPVMIIDIAFHVISWYDGGDFQDKPFQGTVESGELSYEVGSVLLGANASDAHDGQYIDIPNSPYRRRFSALYAGDVHVGYLIIVDIHRQLEQTEPLIFTRIEAVLAKQLMTRLSRDSQLKNSDEAVLLHLLEGRFTDENMFRLQAESAGLASFSPARIALLNLEMYKTMRHAENRLRNAIARLFPNSRVLIFNGTLVLFFRKEPAQDKAEEFCRKNNLRMVISPRVHNLFHLPQAYMSLSEIMEFLVPHIPGPFALYAEPYYGLMMFRHLSSRRDLILPAVRAMGRHDRHENSLYCLTLYTYLCCHHSLQETCQQMYTHRNTILYRIRKMKEEYGIPLEDPAQHAALLMSCALMLLDQSPDTLLPGT